MACLEDSGIIQKDTLNVLHRASENSAWLAFMLLYINHLSVFRCQNIGISRVVIYATLRILISLLF